MKKQLLIIGILILFCNVVLAQEEKPLLNKLVEKNILTQSEADEIKRESAKKTANEKVRNFFTSPYMQFGGSGQLMYKYSDVDNIHHDFKAKNLFISINGKLNDAFRYGLLLESTNPSVQEFWSEWTLVKEFNVKVGQFKSPFTLESQYVPATLETASYSRSISNLVGYAGEDDVLKKQNNKNNFGRDAGIMLSGELLPAADYHLLQYSAGLFQGTGVATSETNNNKDFAGMLLLQPIKRLRIGGGVYYGEATYLDGGETIVSNHVRNRWYLSSDYKSERFNARAEWIHGNDGGVEKEGLYVMGLYYIMPKKLNAVAKFDYYNRNKDVNSEVFDYTLGVNYYIYNQCRIQLNYTYSDYNSNWGAKDSNTVLAQLQIAF